MKLDNRIWIFLTVVVCGALVAGGWFVGAQPQLQSATNAAVSTLDIQSRNVATQTEVDSLKASSAQLPDLQAQLAQLQSAIPPGVYGTAFINSLNTMSLATGASLMSLSLNEARPYAPEGAIAVDSTDSTASTNDVAVAALPTGVTVPATDPLISASNLVIVEISLQVSGTDEQVLNFLDALQNGSRQVLVVTVAKSADDGGVTLDIGAQLFVLRASDNLAPAVTDGAQG